MQMEEYQELRSVRGHSIKMERNAQVEESTKASAVMEEGVAVARKYAETSKWLGSCVKEEPEEEYLETLSDASEHDVQDMVIQLDPSYWLEDGEEEDDVAEYSDSEHNMKDSSEYLDQEMEYQCEEDFTHNHDSFTSAGLGRNDKDEHVITHYNSSHYVVQGVVLRHLSIVLTRINFCEKCSKLFRTKLDLDQHMMKVHPDQRPILAEPSMHRIYLTMDQLMTFGKEFATGKLRQCKYCLELYTSDADVQDHCNVVHCHYPTTYECPMCLISFRQWCHFITHVQTHQGKGRVYMCEGKGKPIMAKKHPCKPKLPKYHKRLKSYPKIAPKPPSHSKPQDLCHTNLSNSTSVKARAIQPTSSMGSAQPAAPKPNLGEPNPCRIYFTMSQFKMYGKPFAQGLLHQCKFCLKVFESNEHLISHCRDVHQRELHICPTCRARFPQWPEFILHVQAHAGSSKVYMCECKKRTESPSKTDLGASIAQTGQKCHRWKYIQ